MTGAGLQKYFTDVAGLHAHPFTVHRSTQEIGGNCIEIAASDGRRLLLDIGRPLDATGEAIDLLPATLDLGGSPAAILISHPFRTFPSGRQ